MGSLIPSQQEVANAARDIGHAAMCSGNIPVAKEAVTLDRMVSDLTPTDKVADVLAGHQLVEDLKRRAANGNS